MISELRDRLIQMQPSWLPTLLLFPVLYGLGWGLTFPLRLIGLASEKHALVGTLISFVLLLTVLPRWCRLRWHARNCWRSLGLTGPPQQGRRSPWTALLMGLGLAMLLLSFVLVPVMLGSWGLWLGEWSPGRILNALALVFGVGLAEELIFRGWLWRELESWIGARSAVITQALIFSLVHTRFNLGFWPMLGLLIGLLLLGLSLAVQRRLDGGSLWGCIGLHGGLVGGWFLVQNGLLQLSPDTPAWLVGPGGMHSNPIGGVVGIAALLSLFLIQFTAVARAARPATGARSDS